MGQESRANKLKAIHPNLNKNEISGWVLGRDIDSYPPRRSPLIEGIFSTSFVMAYPTIQFIILIIKVCDRLQKRKKKKDKKHNSSTRAVKSHIIPAILNKYQMKRIILDSLHEYTYKIYRQGGIVIVYISKNKMIFYCKN